MTWLCLALLVSAASHAVLAWTRVSPYLAIVAMGLAYSVLASALWSLPAILLPPHQLATAFGIMQVNTQFGFVRYNNRYKTYNNFGFYSMASRHEIGTRMQRS